MAGGEERTLTQLHCQDWHDKGQPTRKTASLTRVADASVLLDLLAAVQRLRAARHNPYAEQVPVT